MREFLRPGSIRIYRSVEGHGTPPSVHDYPHQGIDVATYTYYWPWLNMARNDAQGVYAGDLRPPANPAGIYKPDIKHTRTPLGTPVAQLTRTGGDMLASQCGYCGLNLAKCLKAGCGRGHQGDSE